MTRTPEKPPIEAVLSHYGATYIPERHGWASMLCPFHEDKTRSASVNTEKGLFHCFACEATGDAYDLIQLKEGIGFRDAIEFGARIAGEGNASVRNVRPTSQYLPRGKGTGRKPRRYVPPRRRRGRGT